MKKASGSNWESTSLATERHFTPVELAALRNLAQSTIRELFQDEPGVIRMGEPSRRVGRTLKRAYYSMRIPQSVAERVHARLTAPVTNQRRLA